MNAASSSQPRIFYGWWVVLVAVVAMFAATLTGGSGFSVFVLPMTLDLGWDRKTIAGAMGLGTILGALSAPYFGRLVDKYGARVMLTATGFGLAVTLVPITWVQLPVFFYIGFSSARLIDMGVLNTAATTAVANWFVRLRGRALGLTVAGNALGVALVTPLAQWIIADWGWRTAWFVLSAAAVLTLTPLAWLLVRRRPEDLGLYPDGDPAPKSAVPGLVAGSAAAPVQADWLLAAALRTPAFWLLTISGSLTQLAAGGLSFHQVPVLVENGIHPSAAAWVVSLYGVGWALGGIFGGLVAERVPARFVLAGECLLAGACMIAIIHIRDLKPALVYATAYGLVNGGKEALDAVVWADYYGRQALGAIRGFSRPLIVGGNAGGGFIAGWAYDSFGSYGLVLTAFGLLSIFAATLVLMARPPLAKVVLADREVSEAAPSLWRAQ